MNNAQPALAHLHPFLEKLWQEVLQGQARSVFFQGSATEAFSREITRFFARMPGEKVILRRDLDGRPLQAPWFPFLDFVKECTAGREPAALEALLAGADVYSLHRPMVSSWIRGEPLVRDEEMLPDELAFEKGRLEEGILSLLATLSAEIPLLLLVNNLQLAGSAGLALAARLLDRPPPGRLLFVFLLDRNHRHLAEERAQRWSYFLEEVEEKSTILGSGLPEHPVPLPPPQPEAAVGPLVRRCRDAFLLLDHEECRTTGLAAADLVQDAPQAVAPAEWSLLLETLGDVHCLLDEPDAALVYLDQLLHHCREHNLLAGLSAAYRKMGHVYYLKEDNDTAGDFGNQSLKFARQAEDELAVLRACCLLAMIDIRRHNMLLWEKVPELLYPLLKKYRMKNTLSFFYTNSPLYFDKRLEEELALRKKAIAIAKELGNTCRLAHALQTKGVIYNYMGDEARTLRCYTRSLKLREQLEQPREISQVYNGMGYFHYLNGRYDEACRCFNRALEYLKNLREYIEIILTCYNLALVHFYTGQYARAIDHMEKMFVLIKTLGSANIPFHSRLGLYSVAALCHLKHGNYLKGIEYLNKKNGAPERFANDQEYHYHELAGALAAWYEGKDADAAGHFDRAGRYLEQNAGISDFRNMFPPFFHEYGLFLKSTGNAAAAAAVWKKGLGYAAGSGFGWYRELLEAELAGEPPPRPQFRFEEVRFDFDVIIELARQDKNLVLLHKKISEINFLNNLHVILQREGDSRTLAADFMKLVIGHFLAETGLVCLKNRETWETLHTNDPAAAALPELPALLDLLARDGAARLVSAVREDPELGALTGVFNSVIALPLLRSRQVTGMVVVATRQQELVLYENDLRILAIAAAQFSDTLERLELHRTLEEKTRALESANRELNAEKARRDKEYERAKIVQQTIFTSQEEYRHIGGVDIDVLFLPRNDRVSGDYYNILSDGDGQAAFLIADASGHGIQAALSTMQLDLLFKQGLAVSDIARRMEYLNKMLADELHSQNFCTAFAMRLEQHRIRYTSAGHPAQYLVKAGGSVVVALKTPGIPLGIYGDRRYVNGEQAVGPGDILVLFTDGLFEECNARGEIWGEERLLESIVKYAASPDMSMADFNAWLVHDLRSFLGRKSFEDDLTLISVRIR